MSWKDKITQKADWYRAELDPRDEKRQAKRDEYDKKYGKCHHGTHDVDKCPGD